MWLALFCCGWSCTLKMTSQRSIKAKNLCWATCCTVEVWQDFYCAPVIQVTWLIKDLREFEGFQCWIWRITVFINCCCAHLLTYFLFAVFTGQRREEVPLTHQMPPKKLWDQCVGQEEEARVDSGWVWTSLHSALKLSGIAALLSHQIVLWFFCCEPQWLFSLYDLTRLSPTTAAYALGGYFDLVENISIISSP